MLLKISHCTGHVLANTKPHQLHWVIMYAGIYMEFYKKHNHIFYFMISRPGGISDLQSQARGREVPEGE